MNAGLLLDTHVLLWLDGSRSLRPEAHFVIEQEKLARRLFFSDISLWEIGTAISKPRLERRPDLQGFSLELWVANLVEEHRLQHAPISKEIAYEAAQVPSVYRSGDPGDCFLIATARVRNLSLVTRDRRILDLAARNADYLAVLSC